MQEKCERIKKPAATYRDDDSVRPGMARRGGYRGDAEIVMSSACQMQEVGSDSAQENARRVPLLSKSKKCSAPGGTLTPRGRRYRQNFINKTLSMAAAAGRRCMRIARRLHKRR